MSEHIQLGDMCITLTRKAVKNIHLSVHPPDGQVTLVVPTGTRPEIARAYAASKLVWIRKQQEKLEQQARETPRQFVERESHQVWGRRYLLTVELRDAKPRVRLDHRRITLSVRPNSGVTKRASVMLEWYRSLLREALPPLIDKWAARLGVTVSGYFLRRMKTKWGSCNHRRGHIRLNTELSKKPMDLLEYVVVHELIHLIEPTHNDHFVALLTKHYPTWREARAELNELPLTAEVWRE